MGAQVHGHIKQKMGYDQYLPNKWSLKQTRQLVKQIPILLCQANKTTEYFIQLNGAYAPSAHPFVGGTPLIKHGHTPIPDINSRQKWDTKRGSQSEISLHGIPCFATTVAIKIYANSGAVMCTVQGTK